MKHVKRLFIISVCVLIGCSDDPAGPSAHGEIIGAIQVPPNTHAALVAIQIDGEVLEIYAGTGQEYVSWSEDKTKILFVNVEKPLATKIPLHVEARGSVRATLVETANANGEIQKHNKTVPLN